MLNESIPVDNSDTGESKARVVLIVDDEVDITTTFTMLFEIHGFQALSASNGQEALQVLEQNRPDIILSDLMMPVMNGIELSRKVRENPATQHIPIILMSAAPKRHNLKEAAFDAFLQKPLAFVDLLKLIDSVSLKT